MPYYVVMCEVTVSAYAYVEAETPEGALRKGRNLEATVMYGASPRGYFVIEEADGEPCNLHVADEISREKWNKAGPR